MKKAYNNPRIVIVDLGDSVLCDIVASSGLSDNEVGPGSGDGLAGARQRNPIWDDYE